MSENYTFIILFCACESRDFLAKLRFASEKCKKDKNERLAEKLLTNGAAPRDVQELLGHTDAEVL